MLIKVIRLKLNLNIILLDQSHVRIQNIKGTIIGLVFFDVFVMCDELLSLQIIFKQKLTVLVVQLHCLCHEVSSHQKLSESATVCKNLFLCSGWRFVPYLAYTHSLCLVLCR
jgi:hypothetical protein